MGKWLLDVRWKSAETKLAVIPAAGKMKEGCRLQVCKSRQSHQPLAWEESAEGPAPLVASESMEARPHLSASEKQKENLGSSGKMQRIPALAELKSTQYLHFSVCLANSGVAVTFSPLKHLPTLYLSKYLLSRTTNLFTRMFLHPNYIKIMDASR